MTRWAIVGSSGFAEQTCVPTLLASDSTELLGCCGSTAEGGARLARKMSLPKAYETFADVCTDASVEAVWIASPTGFHAIQAIALMEAGKNVLVEKPLALTLAESKQIKATADRTGAKAAVGFHQRFKTAHVRARRELESGKIGNLAYIRCHWFIAYDSEPRAWRRNPETAGGGWAINDIGTHLLDTVGFIAQSEVVAANAIFGHARFAYATDDIFVGALKLSNGALASIEASTAVQGSTTRLELVGDRGSIVVEGSFMNRSLFTMDGTVPEAAEEDQAYIRQIAAFEASLEGGASAVATLDDGIANVRWIGEMLKSR